MFLNTYFILGKPICLNASYAIIATVLDKFKLLQSQLRDKNINIFDISIHIED